MRTNYYSILSRAISELDPNTRQGRRAIYDRARQTVTAVAASSRLSAGEIAAQSAALEAAIARLERRFDWPEKLPASRLLQTAVNVCRHVPTWGGAARSRPGLIFGVVLLAMILIGTLGYWRRQQNSAVTPEVPVPATSSTMGPNAAKVLADTGDLEPGVDGGSSESGIPYLYRRQPVFFRSTFAIGTLVIDRPQRFLYPIQPNNVAIRYGIGIGPDCADTSGLRQIARKLAWPQWEATPSARQQYPGIAPALAGGPGNPLGARAVYLNDARQLLHGTNSPKTIGGSGALGCFRMVNDGISELYDRVAIGGKVLVRN